MQRPNRYDLLKGIALVSMIVDHIGFFLFPEIELLRVFGRIAFPLFLFLVGRNQSWRRRRKLFGVGILVEIVSLFAVWYGMMSFIGVNILLAIVGTRVILSLSDRIGSLRRRGFVFVGSCLLVPWSSGYIDYGTMSILFALLGVLSARYGTTSKKNIIHATLGVVTGGVLLYMSVLNGYSFVSNVFLVGVWLLIRSCMIWMSAGNRSITLTESKKKLLLRISQHTLSIYLVHGVILICIRVLLQVLVGYKLL